MKTVGRVGVLLCLAVGLTLWVQAAVSHEGVLGASAPAPAGQGEREGQRGDQFLYQPDGSTDSARLTLRSASVAAPTATYTVSLPIILAPPCIPSAPGESDNVVDALTVCSGQTVSGLVDDYDWDDVYKIHMVANQHLAIWLEGTGVGGPGDADLYVFPPGTTDVTTDPWAFRSVNDGNSEYIEGTVLAGGYWYIDVFDYAYGDGGTNYNLTVVVSGPGATVGEAVDLPEGDRLRTRGRPKGSE